MGLWLISGTLVAILAVAVIALYRRVRMLGAANPTYEPAWWDPVRASGFIRTVR